RRALFDVQWAKNHGCQLSTSVEQLDERQHEHVAFTCRYPLKRGAVSNGENCSRGYFGGRKTFVTDTALDALRRAQFDFSDNSSPCARRWRWRVWTGPAGKSPPDHCVSRTLAPSRLWRRRPIAISTHHCCADQKTVHLGPRALDQRDPFLSAPGLVCPTAR